MAAVGSSEAEKGGSKGGCGEQVGWKGGKRGSEQSRERKGLGVERWLGSQQARRGVQQGP